MFRAYRGTNSKSSEISSLEVNMFNTIYEYRGAKIAFVNYHKAMKLLVVTYQLDSEETEYHGRHGFEQCLKKLDTESAETVAKSVVDLIAQLTVTPLEMVDCGEAIVWTSALGRDRQIKKSSQFLASHTN